jgi:hypothetical protein
MFRGREILRMATAIVMLGVLLLLIDHARRPETWHWFTGEQAKEPVEVVGGPDPAQPVDRDSVAEVRERSRGLQPVAPQPEEPAVDTDQDSEQWESAQEEFQAITDRTLKSSAEEMAAYWRLFGWAQRQSLEQMQSRAAKRPLFNQFAQKPDEQRGKLFELDLNVRQVLVGDAPQNSAGVKKIYELVGSTDQSQAWLYWVVTAELPAGMPIGADVHERVRFVGYFFKQQGYYAAGAGPNDKPLMAPSLIGKVSWKETPSTLPSSTPTSPWVVWTAMAIGVMIVLRLGMWVFRWGRGAKSQPQVVRPTVDPDKPVDVEGWLAKPESTAAPTAGLDLATLGLDRAHVNGSQSMPHDQVT